MTLKLYFCCAVGRYNYMFNMILSRKEVTMKTMRAMQVPAKGEKMQMVEIPVPKPDEGQVLLKVEACGACNGDAGTINGMAPAYPGIPGHEVIGVIETLGPNAGKWEVGQRVGIGWHGNHRGISRGLPWTADMLNIWSLLQRDYQAFRTKYRRRKPPH